jgi:hypothetical protein
MRSWVLVLLSNEPYIEKAKVTIIAARGIGNWQDDIVLLIPRSLESNADLVSFASTYAVELRVLPDRNTDKIIDFWSKFPTHRHHDYIMSRKYIFMKFYIFDVYFKKWDVAFYMDSGCVINGRLARFKESCEAVNCIYAHSDGYPWYEIKLERQFAIELLDSTRRAELKKYDLDIDYFQTTMCIYDTRILEPNTVDALFDLNERFPVGMRMDQPIINLYFTCMRKLWHQIPLKDDDGFLYDFCERNDWQPSDYLLLKYPKAIMPEY